MTFVEFFYYLRAEKNMLYLASRSQFIEVGPAKSLEIDQQITFDGQNKFLIRILLNKVDNP